MGLNYVFVGILQLTYNHHHFGEEICGRFDLLQSIFLLQLYLNKESTN
jgi:hypothetical protein